MSKLKEYIEVYERRWGRSPTETGQWLFERLSREGQKEVLLDEWRGLALELDKKLSGVEAELARVQEMKEAFGVSDIEEFQWILERGIEA